MKWPFSTRRVPNPKSSGAPGVRAKSGRGLFKKHGVSNLGFTFQDEIIDEKSGNQKRVYLKSMRRPRHARAPRRSIDCVFDAYCPSCQTPVIPVLNILPSGANRKASSDCLNAACSPFTFPKLLDSNLIQSSRLPVVNMKRRRVQGPLPSPPNPCYTIKKAYKPKDRADTIFYDNTYTLPRDGIQSYSGSSSTTFDYPQASSTLKRVKNFTSSVSIADSLLIIDGETLYDEVVGDCDTMDSQLLNDFKPLGSRFKTCFTAGILDNAEVAGSGVCSDKLNADQRFFCQPFYDLPMYETASAVHVNLRRGLLHEYQLYDH